MSRYYDKDILKASLQIEQIFDLLEEWGGEPEYTNYGLVSQTICHNLPGNGSRKLYYYDNTHLCHCFSGCIEPSFDIFDLCIKVMKIQYDLDWELYDAMDYIASYFCINGIEQADKAQIELDDWGIIKKHQIQPFEIKSIQLNEYDPIILERFSYPRILDWEQEGISRESCIRNKIGYYPGGEQITIPHYDINGRLVGIRGRSLVEDDASRYGKYRPLRVGKITYNHPLSMNLYHLNQSKENIKACKIAIIFESEKATMQYESYYGHENDISVACCGGNLSNYQVQLLKSLGVNELIIAFDRDFESIGDELFKRAKAKLIHIYNKYNNAVKISAIFDKHLLLPIKASPIDVSKEVFEKLLNERIVPYD